MLYTVGHSALDEADFLAACETMDVVVDVRSHPTSARTQFIKENMERWLPKDGVDYQWWPSLGGWTAKHLKLKSVMSKIGVDVSVYATGKFPKHHIAANAGAGGPSWRSVGLLDYAYFTALNEFQEGLDELLKLSQTKNVAICCSESKWWCCHRSMIADCAVWRGADALHIMPRFRKIKKPRCVIAYTKHSDFIADRLAAYPPLVMCAWKKWRSQSEKDSIRNESASH